uniref:Uncharacterized protein n=1 Tax=Human herpesvirus 2 TaxID=10310 RepID=A0A481TNL1_HHV2|nr:hypothetical protein [Human alphaherpesvirus 2]
MSTVVSAARTPPPINRLFVPLTTHPVSRVCGFPGSHIPPHEVLPFFSVPHYATFPPHPPPKKNNNQLPDGWVR